MSDTKITNKENKCNFELDEKDTIEIRINEKKVINETVGSLKKALVTFMYQELDA